MGGGRGGPPLARPARGAPDLSSGKRNALRALCNPAATPGAGRGHGAPAALLDVVYHPWPTRLADTADRTGAAVISGFELLVHQAARQVELMTARAGPTAAMRRAGLAELRRRAEGAAGAP